MTHHILQRSCSIAFFGLSLWVQAQPASGPELELRNIIPHVLLSIRISTAAEPLFVPHCGETEYGTRILCLAGVHLQVQSHQEWNPVKLRHTFGVLGVARLARFGGRLIPAHSDASVVFDFSRRWFEVEPGQQLRIIVDAWANEQAMKAGAAPTPLTSSVFRCPQIGTGR